MKEQYTSCWDCAPPHMNVWRFASPWRLSPAFLPAAEVTDGQPHLWWEAAALGFIPPALLPSWPPTDCLPWATRRSPPCPAWGSLLPKYHWLPWERSVPRVILRGVCAFSPAKDKTSFVESFQQVLQTESRDWIYEWLVILLILLYLAHTLLLCSLVLNMSIPCLEQINTLL